jgi:hypothetical protein
MKKVLNTCGAIVGAIISMALAFGIAIGGMVLMHPVFQSWDWNDGYCKCGHEWVYEKETERNGHTFHYYYCPTCDDYFQSNKKW